MQTGQRETRFFDQLRTPEAAPQWGLPAAFFFIVAYIIIWIASLSIVSVINGDISGTVSATSKIFAVILHSVIVLAVVVQWANQRLPNGLNALALQGRTGRALFIAFLVGFGAAVVIDLAGRLLRLTGGIFVPPVFEALRLTPEESISALWVIAALTALIIQPIAEGLIFAGVIYPAFRAQVNDNLLGIGFAAVAFTFVSVIIAVQQESWYTLVQPLLMGGFIFGVRAFTGNTRMAIAARMGFGLWIALSALFSIRFG